jgi:hypothetical protein
MPVSSINGVAYYSVADAKHYPGVVALFNSVRSLGERAPFFIVDCGLTSTQREVLSQQRVILVPPLGRLHPTLQKAAGPLAHPAAIMVLLDADVIVNRSLQPLIEIAALGNLVVFEERIADRFFPEWSELGLGRPVRRPYVSAGHLLIPEAICPEFLTTYSESGSVIEVESTLFASKRENEDPDVTPFFYADQDILNAMLCTRYADQVVRLGVEDWAYPPFEGLKLSREKGVFCEFEDGRAPFLLHHFFKKPWLSPLRPTVYAEVFTQLVTAADAPIRLGPGDIPLRLSGSRLAPLDRWRASLQAAGNHRLRGKLGLRPALERRFRRLVSQDRERSVQ